MGMLSVFRNYFPHSTIIGFILMAIFGLYYILVIDKLHIDVISEDLISIDLDLIY